MIPVWALIPAAWQRETRYREFEHDVVIGKRLTQPVPDLAFPGVRYQARTERPNFGNALEPLAGTACPPVNQQDARNHAA